ncbi:MAG: isoprenylcysteine carboxylmethyltransferase family protein [Planctomycetes bacterium]|nr:isoprenylcysteine carboxylmethyltransferase family protein [Planctomycetota bacterium]
MPASKEINSRRIFVGVVMLALVVFARADLVTSMIGLGFVVFGEFWRVWGCGHLEKNQEVTNTGAFAFVQNPLYLGTLLISVGCSIAAQNAVVLALFILLYFGYYLPYKIRNESDRLRRRFGEAYEDYYKSVPKLIPTIFPYKGRGTKRFSWSLVFKNSELGSALGSIGLWIICTRMWWLPELGFADLASKLDIDLIFPMYFEEIWKMLG